VSGPVCAAVCRRATPCWEQLLGGVGAGHTFDPDPETLRITILSRCFVLGSFSVCAHRRSQLPSLLTRAAQFTVHCAPGTIVPVYAVPSPRYAEKSWREQYEQEVGPLLLQQTTAAPPHPRRKELDRFWIGAFPHGFPSSRQFCPLFTPRK